MYVCIDLECLGDTEEHPPHHASSAEAGSSGVRRGVDGDDGGSAAAMSGTTEKDLEEGQGAMPVETVVLRPPEMVRELLRNNGIALHKEVCVDCGSER